MSLMSSSDREFYHVILIFYFHLFSKFSLLLHSNSDVFIWAQSFIRIWAQQTSNTAPKCYSKDVSGEIWCDEIWHFEWLYIIKMKAFLVQHNLGRALDRETMFVSIFNGSEKKSIMINALSIVFLNLSNEVLQEMFDHN